MPWHQMQLSTLMKNSFIKKIKSIKIDKKLLIEKYEINENL